MMNDLKFYSHKGVYYSEYNIFDNLENLTLRYLDEMFDYTPEHIFLVEGLNKRVSKVTNGFYPTLNKNIHGYKGRFNYNFLDNMEFDFDKLTSVDSRQDEDCDPQLPLYMGLDFGTAINWIVVAQEIQKSNEFNFIKNFYVKFPKIIDHLIQDFISYYSHHKRKIVYIAPDAQGNWRQPNKDETFVQTIVKLLKNAGWQTVVVNNKRYNKEQHTTHLLWSRMLLGRDKNLPKIGFNLINCKELIYSMEQCPAFDHMGKIKKDKRSEYKLITDREKATDASDAADQILYYKYYEMFQGKGFTGLPALLFG